MANSLTAVVGCDSSQLVSSINKAKDILSKYKTEAGKAASEIGKVSSVTSSQVNAYNKVVTALSKVTSGTMTTAQQSKALEKQIQELKIQWANLSSEARKSDFGKSMSASLKSAQSQLATLNKQLDQTKTKLASTSTGKLNFKGLQGQVAGVTSAMSALGLQGGATLSMLSSAGGALINPYTAGAAAIAGATYALVEYNKTLDEQTNKTAKFLGLSEENAVGVRDAIKSISDAYGTDFDSALGMVDQLTKQFGVDAKTATDIISVGMAGGANESGKMGEMISQYSGIFRDMGVSAEQFIGIMSQTQSGIFSEDGMNMISKAGQKLTEMSSKTASSLDAIGISSDTMTKKLADGSMSSFDAMQQISQALSKLSPDTQEYANVVKNVFGKVGVQAGSEMIETLATMDTTIQGVIDNMTEEERATYELQQADQELEDAMASLFGSSHAGFASMTTQIKTKVYRAIATLINGFIDLYNKSTLVRAGVASFALMFKNAWAIIKAACNAIGAKIAGVAAIMEDLISLDFGKVVTDFNKMESQMSDIGAKLGKELVTNISDAFKQTAGGNIQHISVEADVTSVDTSKVDNDKSSGKGGGGKGKGKKTKVKATGTTTDDAAQAAKAAEKSYEQQLAYEKQIAKAKQDNEFKSRQADIDTDTSSNSWEKRQKQLKLDKDKSIAAINSEYADLLSTKIQNEKKLWDSDKSNAGKNFYTSDAFKKIALSEDELTTQTKRLNAVEVKYVNDTNDSITNLGTHISDLQSDLEKGLIPADKVEETINLIKRLSDQKLVLEASIKPKPIKGSTEAIDTQISEVETKIKTVVVGSDEYNQLQSQLKELTEKQWVIQLKAEGLSDAQIEVRKIQKNFESFASSANNVLNSFSSIDGVVSSISTMTKDLDEGSNAWKLFIDVIGIAQQTLSAISSTITAIDTVMKLLGTTTKATAAADSAATASEVTNSMAKTTAKSGEAIANATASGSSMPFPYNLVAIAAGVAAVIAAIAMIGKFANGGIVSGARVGDMNMARVNGGEIIMNGTQQNRLWNILNGTTPYTAQAAQGGNVEFVLRGSDLHGSIKNYQKTNPYATLK